MDCVMMNTRTVTGNIGTLLHKKHKA